jgi:hypothetical protein
VTIGVKVGFLLAWFKKNVKMLPVEDFVKRRKYSILWGLSRDALKPLSIVKLDLGKTDTLTANLRQASVDWISELRELGKDEQAWAALDNKGHMYEIMVRAGKLSPAMLKILEGMDDWSIFNTMPCTFAPYGYHLPLQIGPAFSTEEDYLNWLQWVDPLPSWRPEWNELAAFHQALVPTGRTESRIALGSYDIERSHFTPFRDKRLRLFSYLATTPLNHGLDGYAEHSMIIDYENGELYFRFAGEGRHPWRTIDGANNPVALFVFSVMARSFYRFIELQALREQAGLDPLDFVREPDYARTELRKHIAKVDRQLACDRRRATLLDYLGQWLPLVRYIFGANVVQAPIEVQFPGDVEPAEEPKKGGPGSGGTSGDGPTGPASPGATGTGPTGTGSTGTGPTDTGATGPGTTTSTTALVEVPSTSSTSALVEVPEPKEKEGGDDEDAEEAQRLDPDDFPIWPFAAFVLLLAISDDGPDEGEEVDEDDLEPYFVDMSGEQSYWENRS